MRSFGPTRGAQRVFDGPVQEPRLRMPLRRGQHWSIVVTCSAVAFGCSSLDSGTSFSELPPMNATSGAGSIGSSGGASPQQGGMPQGGGGPHALAGVDAGGGGAPATAGGSAGAPSGVSGVSGAVGAAGGSAEGGSGGGGGAAGSGGLGSGGTDAAGGGAGTPVAFAEVKTILDRSCSGSLGCHGQLGRRPSLRSSDANLYETLETFVVSKCGGDKLVAPGTPSESALLEVVSGGCGSLRMPPSCSGSTCIPSTDLTTVTRWIESGAPRN
jgi:hypothetical protein